MKRIQTIAGLFAATALLFSSCSKEETIQGSGVGGQEEMALTFKLSTPAGDKVVYSRATHDESEYAIRSLTLYEYLITDEGAGTNELQRTFSYTENGSANTLELTDGGNGSYTFTLKVPTDNLGQKYTYRFVANDSPSAPANGSSFDDFKETAAGVTLTEGATADALATAGIAMTGTATPVGRAEEVITMSAGLSCEVKMTRIVSRIDVKYQTPNLKVTAMELRGAPESGYLFPQDAVASPTTNYVTLGMNANVTLPDDYRQNIGGLTEVELKKAFYLYERTNDADDNSAVVHIEYDVLGASGTEYKGAVDVPFKKADDQFVNAQRNHLYTIVLGNATEPEPASGKVNFQLIVDEWNQVDMTETLKPDEKMDVEKEYSEAVLGDIMLSDGTLLDKDYPLSDDAKQKAAGVVAYLYASNPDRIGAQAKNFLKTEKGVDDPTGLVLSLKHTVTTGVPWGLNEDEVVGTGGYPSAKDAYEQSYDGYGDFLTITGKDDWQTNYPAFADIEKFGTNLLNQAPENSTGWYLPSLGEWLDILGQNGLGGGDISTSGSDENVGIIGNVLKKIIEAMSPVGTPSTTITITAGDLVDSFISSYTSTECNATSVGKYVYVIIGMSNEPTITNGTKNSTMYATRPVFAF